jgi:protein-cysteine N-palmitoyltransferase HHAT
MTIMSLHDLRKLFSLETLDTRFVVPATASPKEALEQAALDPANPLPVQSGGFKSKDSIDNVQPPRWNTPEFYLYYLVFLICIPLMFKSVLDVSKGKTSPKDMLLHSYNSV